MTLIQNRILDPARAMLKGLPRQLRDHLWWYVAVLVVLTVLGAIVLHLHVNTHIIIGELFVDPVDFGVMPFHIGTYTYISATVMVVGGSLMLFAAWSASNLARSMKLYLTVLGAFILWLGLDDVFMIHEWVGLRLAWFIGSENVPRDRQWLESFVFAAYALTWVGTMLVFVREVIRTAWILLALTFVSFGVSVILDLYTFLDFLPNPTTRGQAVFKETAEEMAKLAGGLFVLAYATHVSRNAVRGAFPDQPPDSV